RFETQAVPCQEKRSPYGAVESLRRNMNTGGRDGSLTYPLRWMNLCVAGVYNIGLFVARQ
ncbi:hypothetical protein A2U01_0100467, partial [Trifolium medium]|nr:hypothetical protein [Trifolium medium]